MSPHFLAACEKDLDLQLTPEQRKFILFLLNLSISTRLQKWVQAFSSVVQSPCWAVLHVPWCQPQLLGMWPGQGFNSPYIFLVVSEDPIFFGRMYAPWLTILRTCPWNRTQQPASCTLAPSINVNSYILWDISSMQLGCVSQHSPHHLPPCDSG